MTPHSGDEHGRELPRDRRDRPADGHRSRLVLVAALAAAVLGAVGAAWAVRQIALPSVDGGVVDAVRDAYLAARGGLLDAPSDSAAEVDFRVAPDETVADVAARLAADGLVRDAGAFRLLARARGLDRSIQAGRHRLRRDMTAEEVLAALQSGRGDEVTVTLREGLRAEEVADVLAARGLVDRDAFLARVAEGDGGDRPSLAGRPEGATLEGYLFPDTYGFEPGAGVDRVVSALLDVFEQRAGDLLAGSSTTGLTAHQVVTLASIVEREAAVADERGRIARVFRNRLAEPPYLLNADPTVQYALGPQADAGTWWKRPLLASDLAVDSPYNSYTTPGLPPGPIASPGLASIRAAIEAPEGDWRYFVANDRACDGTHVFAVTFEEHLANVAAYQTGECGR